MTVDTFTSRSSAISSRVSHILINISVSSWVETFFPALRDFSGIFCFSSTPPRRVIASFRILIFSASLYPDIFSCTFSEVARRTRSYSMTRGSIWSAVSLHPLSVSHERDRTRERATYPCPGTNASERSMTAESSVIP